MKLIPCPHCGREVSRSVLRKHIDACPANPATRPHTAALLADPDNPGYIRQYNDYQRVQHNSPAASTLMLMTMYGSWPGVAAAFGLLNDEAIKLNAPLSDDERHACARRGRLERE